MVEKIFFAVAGKLGYNKEKDSVLQTRRFYRLSTETVGLGESLFKEIAVHLARDGYFSFLRSATRVAKAIIKDNASYTVTGTTSFRRGPTAPNNLQK